MEVPDAATSLARGRKSELYAAAGVGEHWIIDVAGRVVEVRREPGTEGYGRTQEYGIGDVIPSPVPGIADLPVADLFEGVPTSA